jgi:hypothetical protein
MKKGSVKNAGTHDSPIVTDSLSFPVGESR